MNKPRDNIRIIAISGRIGAGSTSLGKNLVGKLGWDHLSGGEIFWKARHSAQGLDASQTHLRPDQEDILFDQELKRIFREDNHIVVESKLAGFMAQGVKRVFKILVICENKHGQDQPQIRVDRLLNREGISSNQARHEVIEREKNDLEKWSRLYADGDKSWTYYDPSYFDLIINTYDHNQEEALELALISIGAK